MIDVYKVYCRNYNDAINELEKLKNEPEILFEFLNNVRWVAWYVFLNFLEYIFKRVFCTKQYDQILFYSVCYESNC